MVNLQIASLLCSFLLTAYGDTPEHEESELSKLLMQKVQNVVDIVKLIKNESLYDHIDNEIAKIATAKEPPSLGLDFDRLDEFILTTVQTLKLLPQSDVLIDIYRSWFKIWKLMLPRNAKPTDDQLKQLSKEVVNKTKSFSQEEFKKAMEPYGAVLQRQTFHLWDSESVAKLASVLTAPVHVTPTNSCTLTESLKDLDRELRGASLYLNCAANLRRSMDFPAEALATVHKQMGFPVEYCTTFASCHITKSCNVKKVKETCQNSEHFAAVAFGYFLDSIIHFFRNEENVFIWLKELVVTVQALKNPSSYESFEKFVENIQESEMSHASAVFWDEIVTCKYDRAEQHEKEVMRTLFDLVRHLGAAVLPDDAMLNASLVISKISSSLKKNSVPPVAQELLNIFVDQECFWTEKDQASKSGMPLLASSSREDFKQFMERVKEKSVKLHAFFSLSAPYYVALSRREGLSAEGKEFLLKELKHVINFFVNAAPDQHELERSWNALKEEMKKDMKALSEDTRKNLITVFPYRSLFTYSILH